MKKTSLAMLVTSTLALVSCAAVEPQPNNQLAMAKQACAEVGLTPGTDAFSDCFLSIDGSITFDHSAAYR